MSKKLLIPSMGCHPAYLACSFTVAARGMHVTFHLEGEEINAWIKTLQRAVDCYRPWIVAYYTPVAIENGVWGCMRCPFESTAGDANTSLLERLRDHLVEKHPEFIVIGELNV